MPQLAAHFYRQSIEERNHAMMLVQYRLDRDLGVTIPGIPAVQTAFADHREPIRLALAQEKQRSEEHTSELQSLMRISYAVFCLKKKKNTQLNEKYHKQTERR